MINPVVKVKINKILAKIYHRPESYFNPEMYFIYDLFTGKVRFGQVIIHIEEAFGIEIDDYNFRFLDTVGAVYDFISYTLVLQSEGYSKRIIWYFQNKRLVRRYKYMRRFLYSEYE